MLGLVKVISDKVSPTDNLANLKSAWKSEEMLWMYKRTYLEDAVSLNTIYANLEPLSTREDITPVGGRRCPDETVNEMLRVAAEINSCISNYSLP
jgi:hypothetical protein